MLDALVLLPAGVCVGCATRGVRPGRVPGTVAAVLMLLAMLDIGIGPGLVAPPVWAAALLVAGVVLAVAGRAAAGPPAHLAHAAVGLVLMGALIIGMGMDSASTTSAIDSMPAMGPSPFAALMLVGTLAFAAASAVLVVRERSLPRRLESAAMAVSVALMALPILL